MSSTNSDPYVPGQLGSLFGWTNPTRTPTPQKKREVKTKSDDEAAVPPAISAKVDLSEDKGASETEPKGPESDVHVQDTEQCEANTDEANKKAETRKKDGKFVNSDERTLFVGNVPVRIDGNVSLAKVKTELRKRFSKYGKVQSLRLRSLGIAKVAVPTGSNYKTMRKVSAMKNTLDQNTTSCNAYIVYASKEGVENAAKRFSDDADTLFLGNRLRVDRVGEYAAKGDASNNKAGASSSLFDRRRTVFCGNLSFDASEEMLRKAFNDRIGKVGAVEGVRIIRDRHTNIGKGFGYVLLASSDMIEDALTLNETIVDSRKIRVSKCERSASIYAARRGGRKEKDGSTFMGQKATMSNKKAAKFRVHKKKGFNPGVKKAAAKGKRKGKRKGHGASGGKRQKRK